MGPIAGHSAAIAAAALSTRELSRAVVRWSSARNVSFGMIKDGTSNTMVVSECSNFVYDDAYTSQGSSRSTRSTDS